MIGSEAKMTDRGGKGMPLSSSLSYHILVTIGRFHLWNLGEAGCRDQK